jgi:anti-anti-sigma regulatory factor
MSTSRPQTVAFAIRGPIAPDDLPGLCDRVCELLAESGARLALCDVCDVDVDAVTVDALARMQLAARRRGCRVCLCNCSPELRELVSFMGLENVFAEPANERSHDGKR